MPPLPALHPVVEQVDADSCLAGGHDDNIGSQVQKDYQLISALVPTCLQRISVQTKDQHAGDS